MVETTLVHVGTGRVVHYLRNNPTMCDGPRYDEKGSIVNWDIQEVHGPLTRCGIAFSWGTGSTVGVEVPTVQANRRLCKGCLKVTSRELT